MGGGHCRRNGTRRRDPRSARHPDAVTVLPAGLRAAETVRLPPASSSKIDFARHIEPLLKSRCHICHGAQLQTNGSLDRKSDALRGGYSGPAIDPGDSANSRLIRMVAGAEKGRVMPPAGPKPARLAGVSKAHPLHHRPPLPPDRYAYDSTGKLRPLVRQPAPITVLKPASSSATDSSRPRRSRRTRIEK